MRTTRPLPDRHLGRDLSETITRDESKRNSHSVASQKPLSSGLIQFLAIASCLLIISVLIYGLVSSSFGLALIVLTGLYACFFLVKKTSTSAVPKSSTMRDTGTVAEAVEPTTPLETYEEVKPVKQVKHPRPSVVPTLGLRGKIWRLAGSNLYDKFAWKRLSKLSKHELEVNRELELQARFTVASQTIWDMRKVQSIFWVGNSKGGSGKTPLAAWLAGALQMTVQKSVIVYDANMNGGHAAKLYGIKREDTMQVVEFIQKFQRVRHCSHEDFIDLIDWDRKTGVGVIASNLASTVELSKADHADGVLMAKTASHSVVVDTGNGFRHASNTGTALVCDVMLIPGRYESGNSLDDVETTREQYTIQGFGQKIKNGLVIIIGAKPEQRQMFAERYNVPVEQVFVLPYNKYMADDSVVDFSQVTLEIKVVLLEILCAAIKAERVPEESVIVRSYDGTRTTEPHQYVTAAATAASAPSDDDSRQI